MNFTMKKINPLYVRYNKGWPLRNFFKFGGIVGIVIGIIMTFCLPFFQYFPLIIAITSSPPFAIIGYFVKDFFRGDAALGLWPIVLLLFIIASVLYHVLLGVSAGFISNVMLCIYKKVKVKITEEDNNIDYLDFSKNITKKEIIVFFIFGTVLTCLIVAALLYYLLIGIFGFQIR